MTSKVNPGRLLAAQVLKQSSLHAQDALEQVLLQKPCDAADRALAWNLIYGILRERPLLDAVITTAAKRPIKTLDPMVRVLLWIGIYELRKTRVPPHAAVDQAVAATRLLKVGHAAGFVNAVLRNQHRYTPELSGAASLGFPDWLAARWSQRDGQEMALSRMQACNQPAPIFLAAKEDIAGIFQHFLHQGISLLPTSLPTIARLPAGAGAIENLPGFQEGSWWIMDVNAAKVAELVPAGVAVLDACASPGGKSFYLAARGQPVTATDLPERLDRLNANQSRLGLPIEILAHDWEKGPLVDKSSEIRRFPAVLVDAPCSSLGLCGRHPDIRWHRSERDLRELGAKQRLILQNAARCVAPGGALIYAVCSLEPEEGEEIIKSLGWPVEEHLILDRSSTDYFFGCRLRAPA
jgi:16S rRNA (cytosine967-C5)-methyltransferase